MFEYTKLISKEFLKQGTVTELLKLDPDCEASLLNEVQLMESLLDHPQHSDNAQKRLTHLVYKYLDGYVSSFDQDPETFINHILHISWLMEPTKLISKDFLKQGKVSRMIDILPNRDTDMFNRAKELENLLDDPNYSDNAQQELTEIVYLAILGIFKAFREDPEMYVQFITNFFRQSQ